MEYLVCKQDDRRLIGYLHPDGSFSRNYSAALHVANDQLAARLAAAMTRAGLGDVVAIPAE
jgi:hypothetical protein